MRKANGQFEKKHPAEFVTKIGGKATPIFRRWRGMKGRCSKSAPEFTRKIYYDRGITVCEEWMDYMAFAVWAKSNGFREDLQLDRIDGTKGYSPENCRFVTAKENLANRDTSTCWIRGAATYNKLYNTPFICRETEEVFESQSEAGRAMGIPRESIGKCLRGGCRHAGGYTFSYLVNA